MSAAAKVAGGATPGSFGLTMAGYSTAHWGATPCIEDRPCPRVRPTLNYIIPSLNKTADCTRRGDILSISATSSTCDRAPNRSMQPKNRRVMPPITFLQLTLRREKHHVQTHRAAPEAPTPSGERSHSRKRTWAAADICSLRRSASRLTQAGRCGPAFGVPSA
jgi:hypothetical protein